MNRHAGDIRRFASIAMPGTCGELVQGMLDGVPCLVSCPISRCGVATVELWQEEHWDIPQDAPKSAAAIEVGLNHLSRPSQGGTLRLSSDLPRGRGYASSTADVGAALFALGEVLDNPLTDTEVAQLAVTVEPSDSTIYSGLAVFDHRCGSFHLELGPAPALAVIVVDPGGAVDTIEFNRSDHLDDLRKLAPQHREAFDLLELGLSGEDWTAVGEAATTSATAHQAILPHPMLERVLELSEDVDALGVCRAHSGTILGILLDDERADVQAVRAFVQRSIGSEASVSPYRLVNGGPRKVDDCQ